MILNYQLEMQAGIPIESEFAIMRHSERSVLYSAIKQLADYSVIVEVGSFIGGSASLMAAANSTITVNCIEAFLGQGNIQMWNHTKTQIHHSLRHSSYKMGTKPDENQLNMLVSSIDNSFLIDPSGKLAFETVTKNFSNIKLHPKESPINFLNWSQPIDMYLEDATHHNPVLYENIKFWSNHIKPGGFIIGHDYQNLDTGSYPDVISEFNKLIINGWDLISKVHSLIILQKPRLQ